MLVIGLISGTSADGIDAALVRVEEAPPEGDGGPKAAPTAVRAGALRLEVLAFLTCPYPEEVRSAVLRAAAGRAGTAEICRLYFVLGEEFARAALRVCSEAGVTVSEVAAVGSHGQTVWHDPFPEARGVWHRSSTLQLGQPAVIAERTGLTVVADFGRAT